MAARRRGKYSPFYRCGYSPDQANGVGNLNGNVPFTSCSYSRSDCEQRGMFTIDTSGRATAVSAGSNIVPPTILVRGAGQKNSQLSAVQDNTARYNDFVPLVYGTQWTYAGRRILAQRRQPDAHGSAAGDGRDSGHSDGSRQ